MTIHDCIKKHLVTQKTKKSRSSSAHSWLWEAWSCNVHLVTFGWSIRSNMLWKLQVKRLGDQILVRSTMILLFREGNGAPDVARRPLVPISGPETCSPEALHEVLLDQVMNCVVLGIIGSPIQWQQVLNQTRLSECFSSASVQVCAKKILGPRNPTKSQMDVFALGWRGGVWAGVGKFWLAWWAEALNGSLWAGSSLELLFGEAVWGEGQGDLKYWGGQSNDTHWMECEGRVAGWVGWARFT